MTIEQLKELPLAKIFADDCALFLWTTDFHLPFCFELFKAWGFKYRTIAFVWKKVTKNGKTCANLGACLDYEKYRNMFIGYKRKYV